MHLIADILSFNNNQEELTEHFKQTAIDWDAVVIIGSKHLMLPALYCKLKTKDLLHFIPEELQIYLEEITAINRGRNNTLLKEAHEISNIFKKENIEHVFIKGIALIAGNTFEDIAERMIGDIDILVTYKHIDLAFDILTKHGFLSDSSVSKYKQKNHRHLTRQISPQRFGAIELHSNVLINKYKHLIINEEVLKNKQIINNMAIPSNEDSIKIAILSLQINDKAYLLVYLAFKTIYDCLALNLISNQLLLQNLGNEKHFQSFLNIANIFFKELVSYKLSNRSIILKHYFVFRLNHPKLGHLIYFSVSTTIITFERLIRFLVNKSYRLYIFRHYFPMKELKPSR